MVPCSRSHRRPAPPPATAPCRGKGGRCKRRPLLGRPLTWARCGSASVAANRNAALTGERRRCCGGRRPCSEFPGVRLPLHSDGLGPDGHSYKASHPRGGLRSRHAHGSAGSGYGAPWFGKWQGGQKATLRVGTTGWLEPTHRAGCGALVAVAERTTPGGMESPNLLHSCREVDVEDRSAIKSRGMAIEIWANTPSSPGTARKHRRAPPRHPLITVPLSASPRAPIGSPASVVRRLTSRPRATLSDQRDPLPSAR